MTGLNLESFLRLLRADLGAWLSLALVVLVLALMAWTSWGSRRALRNCLVLSILVHFGVIFYGSSSPAVRQILEFGLPGPRADDRDVRVRVAPWVAPEARKDAASKLDGGPARDVAAWDRAVGPLALAEPARRPPTPEPTPASIPVPVAPPAAPAPVAPEAAAPAIEAPGLAAPEPPAGLRPEAPGPDPGVAPPDPADVAPPADAAAPPAESPAGPASARFDGGADLRSLARRSSPAASPGAAAGPSPVPGRPPVALPATVPRPPSTAGPDAALSPPDTPTASPSGLAQAPTGGESLPPAATEPEAPADLPGPAAPVAVATASGEAGLAEPDLRRSLRATREAGAAPAVSGVMAGVPEPRKPVDLARAVPASPSGLADLTRNPGRAIARRPLAEVPPVYRSRLDPNRTVKAQRSGASLASEQAVERALHWLAEHQDADGRWDGGTARYRDGSVAGNDDSFTIHCPAGEVCSGECFYWEADTALTGLSLLAYLGAGYTHIDGKYASTVGRGIDFLRRSQKADGDLRGQSVAVGMYCHSMATLALCEAYALTGDARLRPHVEKAVAFLVSSKARDGLAWRYAPGAPVGDTSILGWAVMALKSAKTVGIPIDGATQAGLQAWLRKVGAGQAGGLARYQPGDRITPTMTAEAWACRQFLELGGPGPASDEAAASLLENPTDRADFNIYYLYYGTLAMYQHGGSAWAGWNARVRDQVVDRQHRDGHRAGSWDPDDSPYGTHGGRIYGTALATLTLEVYYRFLRLYDQAPGAPKPGDPGARRAGFDPRPKPR